MQKKQDSEMVRKCCVGDLEFLMRGFMRFLGLLTEMLLYNEIGMRAPYESIKSFFHSLHLNSLLYQSR